MLGRQWRQRLPFEIAGGAEMTSVHKGLEEAVARSHKRRMLSDWGSRDVTWEMTQLLRLCATFLTAVEAPLTKPSFGWLVSYS